MPRGIAAHDRVDLRTSAEVEGVTRLLGEPTAGEVIIINFVTLFDRTGLSLPGMRELANDGTEMEGHPRQVDIAVERPFGESRTVRDRQFDAAIRHLMRSVQRRSTGRP